MSNKIILILLLSIFSMSCAQKKEEQPKPKDKFQQMIELLKSGMISYMENANPSYTLKDVEKCEAILNEYLTEIRQTSSKENGMAIVKSTILQLNALNEKCQGQLIETGEREQIAEIIILASSEKGYNKIDEDITEKWRDW